MIDLDSSFTEKWSRWYIPENEKASNSKLLLLILFLDNDLFNPLFPDNFFDLSFLMKRYLLGFYLLEQRSLHLPSLLISANPVDFTAHLLEMQDILSRFV